MAKCRVSLELVESMVFGYAPHPVSIKAMSADLDRGEVTFEIEGHDVPEVREVRGLIHLQENRAGQRFCTQSFETLQ